MGIMNNLAVKLAETLNNDWKIKFIDTGADKYDLVEEKRRKVKKKYYPHVF